MFAVYDDSTPEILDDAITDAQAETHSFTNILGRKEGIENLANDFWVNALTIIAYRQNT